MPDTLSAERRSDNMARIRDRDTKPEMLVRRLVHRMGYRFRLQRRDLPGKPDLTFPSRRKVIFVHGCFWHLHPDEGCKLARMPRSRPEYWRPKLEGNRKRDDANLARLAELGWVVLVVWECQLRDVRLVEARIKGFLE